MTVTNGSCRILCQTSSSVPSLHSSFQEMELHDIPEKDRLKHFIYVKTCYGCHNRFNNSFGLGYPFEEMYTCSKPKDNIGLRFMEVKYTKNTKTLFF